MASSSGTVIFYGGNNVTLKTGVSSIEISGPNTHAQQTAISGIGNSETTYTSGTVSLSAGNNISISSGTGQRFIIAGPNSHAQQTAISGIANSETTYTSGTVSLSAMGNLIIRSTTGNQFQLSVPLQTVQAETQTFVGGVAGSNTTFTSGTVEFTGSNMVTVKSSANQRLVIDATQSVQTQGVLNAGISGGNTSGDTGLNSGTRLAFAGGNNITLSGATAGNATTITISGANAGGAQTAISGIAASNTTYTSGTVTITGVGGGITVSSNTGQRIDLSVAAQTNQSAIKAFGASNVGNTAGNTGVSTGVDWVLAGTTNITVSESTAVGGPNTLWLSAAPAGAGAGFSAGASNLGNTAGSTGVTGTRVVLVGSNNNSLSQSTDANGATITINNTQPSFSAGVSTMGNTAGSTGVSGTRLVLVGANDISLSQSTNSAGATISILDANPLQMWDPGLHAFRQTVAFPNATLQMQPLPIPEPGIQYDRMYLRLHYSQASNSTLTVTISGWAGLYTKNASTLSLVGSTSTSLSINGQGVNNSATYLGERLFTMGSTTTLLPGDYWLGYVARTTTAGANASFSLLRNSAFAASFSGVLGVASNASAQLALGLGNYSVSTAGMPSSIGFAELRATDNPEGRQAFAIGFRSGTV